MVRAFHSVGVSISEAAEKFKQLAKVLEQIPKIEKKHVMLAWKREWGMLRFLHPEWWSDLLFWRVG